MKQYTKKQLREFVRLGLAVDLTEAEPEKIPASYTKVGFSRGIYGLNGGLIWDNVLGCFCDCCREAVSPIVSDGFNTIVARNREFETVVNAFCFYNCNGEMGRYPAFYVKMEG